jgi:hypothetical protein
MWEKSQSKFFYRHSFWPVGKIHTHLPVNSSATRRISGEAFSQISEHRIEKCSHSVRTVRPPCKVNKRPVSYTKPKTLVCSSPLQSFLGGLHYLGDNKFWFCYEACTLSAVWMLCRSLTRSLKCDGRDARVTPFYAALNIFFYARSVFSLAYLSTHLTDTAYCQVQWRKLPAVKYSKENCLLSGTMKETASFHTFPSLPSVGTIHPFPCYREVKTKPQIGLWRQHRRYQQKVINVLLCPSFASISSTNISSFTRWFSVTA